MKILVTGATGKLGRSVLDNLLKTIPANQLAVSVRNPDKAQDLSDMGVDVRQGNFDDPQNLAKTFSGIDKLLLISTDGDTESRIRQHGAAVDAAQKAQVKFIAYTSLVNSDTSTLGLAQVHQATEAKIKDSGIPYAFLRNNWYLENEASGIQGVLAGGSWLTSAGSGKVGWALRQDYAAAAAAVMANDGHDNKIYELSGNPVSQDEFAAILGSVLGKPVEVKHVDDETYAGIMIGAGLPKPLVDFLVDIQKGIRQNSLESNSKDFEKLVGRPATSVREGIEQLVHSLR